VTDWGTVAASLSGLGGAVVGGGVGYLGARLQASVAHDQAEISRHQIDIEAERYREERRDASVQRRTEIYQQFLDHERWLATRMSTGIEPLDRAGYLNWLDGYNHRYNALLLAATSRVRKAVEELDEAYKLFHADYSANPSEGLPAFASQEGEVSAARDNVVEAMARRHDAVRIRE
jgi:hypothetical protein